MRLPLDNTLTMAVVTFLCSVKKKKKKILCSVLAPRLIFGKASPLPIANWVPHAMATPSVEAQPVSRC